MPAITDGISFLFRNLNITVGELHIGSGFEGMREPAPMKAIDGSRPQLDGNHPVKPGTNCALGTICARLVFSGTIPIAVKAFVFPEDYIDAIKAFPHARSVAGTKEKDVDAFLWTDTNRIPGADHFTGSGRVNYLAYWTQATAGGAYQLVDSIKFNGITGNTDACGGGSGSGSMAVAQSFGRDSLKILGGAGALEVTIPDGPHRGRYPAPPVGTAMWEAVIASVKHTITVGGCGRRLVLATPLGKTVSEIVSDEPIAAMFAGNAFHSDRAVMVTVA